jgi:hypothetical protein
MFWILIFISIFIIIFFILSIIGLSYNKTPKLTLVPDFSTDTTDNHSRTLCLKQKVNCYNDDDCDRMCMEKNNIQMVCQKLNNNTTYEYIFKFAKNQNSIKKGNENVNSVTQITIPVKDKNNKLVLFNNIRESKFIYINFKPDDDVNYNYNFICYSITNSQLNDSNIIIDISFFKNLTTIKNISDKEAIDIKIIDIDTQSEEGVCAPANKNELPKCDITKGGMLVWSGWTQPEADMGWQCICNYPAFASGEGCSKINANVCIGGKLDWKENQLPTEATCTCDKDMTEIRDYRGVPYCVPSEKVGWYTNYFQTNGDIIN